MPKPRAYVGLDPGATGGMAVVWLDGSVSLYPWKKYKLEGIVYQLTSLKLSRDPFAVLENVGGYVKGSGGNIGSAMFQFGRLFGQMEAALLVAGYKEEKDVRRLAPATWHGILDITKDTRAKGAGAGAEPKINLKRVLLARARGMYPGTKITLEMADAVLLAECARRIKEGLV